MTSNAAARSRPPPSPPNKETNDEPFPGQAVVLHARQGGIRRRPWRDDDRGPLLGGRLPQALAARQDRALDARRELHGLLLVEGLRQGRHRHLGNPADRLSAHAAGSAQSRTARLRARRQLQLVPLFRQPREIPAGALAAVEAVARGAGADDAGGGVEVDRRGSEEARVLCAEARPRRFRSRQLGRGQRDRCLGERLHRQDLWPRPRVRLLADPGDVDGELRGRRALSVAARRRLHVVLRLVLRLAAGLAADLGRADRRAGKRRLVQFRLPDPVGIERPADAHARCAFLYRGSLQGRQERRDLPGLFGSLEIRRSLGVAEAGHRRRAGDGDGPRHPEGIPRRSSDQIFQRLCAPVYGHAISGAAGEIRGTARA